LNKKSDRKRACKTFVYFSPLILMAGSLHTGKCKPVAAAADFVVVVVVAVVAAAAAAVADGSC
jgi:hypothetical protein